MDAGSTYPGSGEPGPPTSGVANPSPEAISHVVTHFQPESWEIILSDPQAVADLEHGLARKARRDARRAARR